LFSKGKLILYALPTIISVLILSVAFPNPTIMIYRQEASAQMTDNTFKTYQNPTYGIQIQHPSDWRIDEGDVYADDYVTDIVSFIAPIRSDTESYAPSLSISIDNPPPNLKENLNEYLNRITNDYDDILKGFEIIESDTSSILAGKPAYKLVSTDEEDGIDYKSMEIGTIIGDKVYFVTYYAEEEQYSNYLPTIEKMIDSFQLGDTNPTLQESPLSSPTIEPETQVIPNELQTQQQQQQSPSIDFDIPAEQEP
jgi:hypothetical protein